MTHSSICTHPSMFNKMHFIEEIHFCCSNRWRLISRKSQPQLEFFYYPLWWTRNRYGYFNAHLDRVQVKIGRNKIIVPTTLNDPREWEWEEKNQKGSKGREMGKKKKKLRCFSSPSLSLPSDWNSQITSKFENAL